MLTVTVRIVCLSCHNSYKKRVMTSVCLLRLWTFVCETGSYPCSKYSLFPTSTLPKVIWLAGCVLRHINSCRLLNAKFCFYIFELSWLENPANTHMRPLNSEQLFRPYWVSSTVHTVIFTTGDRTNNHSRQKPKIYHWATGSYHM